MLQYKGKEKVLRKLDLIKVRQAWLENCMGLGSPKLFFFWFWLGKGLGQPKMIF